MIILGAWYARKRREEQEVYVAEKTSWTALVPPFIIGFLVLAVAKSMNLLPDFTFHFQESRFWAAGDVPVSMSKAVTSSSLFLVTMAMAGVGLGVHLKTLLKVGLKALYVGMFSALVLSVFSYGLLLVMV